MLDEKRCWWLVAGSIGRLLFMNTFSAMSKLLTPNMYGIAGVVKHLPSSVALISVWMALAISPFAHQQTNNRLLFLAAPIMFTTDVTVTSSKWNSQLVPRIKFPTKRISWIFHILKIYKMMPFKTYLWNDPHNMVHCTVQCLCSNTVVTAWFDPDALVHV